MKDDKNDKSAFVDVLKHLKHTQTTEACSCVEVAGHAYSKFLVVMPL